MRRAALALLLVAATASAELAPEVYAELQRNAPELLRIEVTETSIRRSVAKPRGCRVLDFEVSREVTVRAKVLAVKRSTTGVRAGDTITIRYTSTLQCEGWSGARPIPVVKKGDRLYAFLARGERQFAPAAHAASFASTLP